MIVPSLIAALAAAAPQQERDAAPSRTQRAVHLYESNCSACHVPPDPSFATERAWLDQLAVTA